MFNVTVKRANNKGPEIDLKEKILSLLASKQPKIQSLIQKEIKYKEDVAELLGGVESREQMIALINEARNTEIRSRAEQINRIYEKLSSKPSVETFSHYLQRSKAYAETIEDNEVKKAAIDCLNIADPGGFGDQPWLMLISGLVEKEKKKRSTSVKFKFEEKEKALNPIMLALNQSGMTLDDLNKNFESIKKLETLSATKFNPGKYPLNDDNYWPSVLSPMDKFGERVISTETLDKISETIPLVAGNEQRLASDISEAIFRNIKEQSSNNPKILKLTQKYGTKNSFNQDAFLNFLKSAWRQTNPEYNNIDNIISDIKSNIASFLAQDTKKISATIIPGYPILFDSVMEKDVVELINNHFGVSCVQSRITFPTPNDCPVNIGNFEVDFVIYCDVLKNSPTPQEPPIIEKQVLLVGEYYGFNRPNEQILTKDLILPDGNIFKVERNGEIIDAVAGVKLTIGEIYKVKTIWKKITEEVASKALGYGTISIEAARNKEALKSNIRQGLNQNNVIFYEKDGGEKSVAAEKISAFNISLPKEDIFKAVVEAEIAKIQAHVFSVEIQRYKTEKNSSWSGKKMSENKENVLNLIRKVREDNTYRSLKDDADRRISALRNLYQMIQGNIQKISPTKTMEVISSITNFGEKEIPVTFNIMKEASRRLFNLLKFGR